MKLIILDRDGVINHGSEHYIKTPDEWLPIAGSLTAIAELKQAGFTIAVATNQSGIARGLYDEAILTAIHDKMQQQVAAHGGHIDKIVHCPHMPDAGCACRKPQPGLDLTEFQMYKRHWPCKLSQYWLKQLTDSRIYHSHYSIFQC